MILETLQTALDWYEDDRAECARIERVSAPSEVMTGIERARDFVGALYSASADPAAALRAIRSLLVDVEDALWDVENGYPASPGMHVSDAINHINDALRSLA